MKANKSKLRILSILLAMLLMLASMPGSALAAAKNYAAVVKTSSMKVYRDSKLKKYWGKVPKNTVVTVKSTSGKIAKVSYNGKTGYTKLSNLNAVSSVGKKAVAKKNTRIFQTASTRSKSTAVKKGTSMYVLAVKGDCARVVRGGKVGYAFVDHLTIKKKSSSSSSSSTNNNNKQDASDRFDQAFAQQQQNQSKPQKEESSTSTKPMTEIEKIFASGKYTNEQLCYQFLVKVAGYNQAAACGIVANIKYESGFKPGSIGDSGKSMGICQWYSSRKTRLINWCKDNDHDPETLLGQLYFLQYELLKHYPKHHKYLLAVENTAQGAYDAAYYFCYNFERPSNKEKSSVTRGNYAMNTTWKKFVSA